MRFANRAGRAFVLRGEDAGWDLERASDGRFSADPMAMWARHEEIRGWVASLDEATAEPVRADELDAPVPVPPAIIAIGLNYAEHARETGFEPPTELPPIFAKFPSSITGAHGEVPLPEGGTVDWEVEVVAVVGSPMHRVARGGRLRPPRRAHRGPGPVRAHPSVLRAGAAVRARQEPPEVRADRPLGGLARRARRPERPRPGLQHRRRGGAAGQHRGADLLHLPLDRRALAGARAAPRRPGVHRHPRRCRAWA